MGRKGRKDYVSGQLIYWGGTGGDSYATRRMTVGSMWWYVIGWGKNIKGSSFVYSWGTGASGRNIIRSYRKSSTDILGVRQAATSPCSLEAP